MVIKTVTETGPTAHEEDVMKKTLISISVCISLIAGSLPAFADFAEGVRFYGQHDYKSALREFTNDGSASSCFYLSLMHQKGEGVPQDMSASLSLLRQAAEQGLDVAQANLGLLYLEGAGVPVNEQEGLKWLRMAADQGLAEAQSALHMQEQIDHSHDLGQK
jgi:TPR repeat protein